MSIYGIFPEENEFIGISMNPDESLQNSSLDFEIIQMENARSNVSRLIEELVPGFHTTEIPNDDLESKFEETCHGCLDSSQSSDSDTESTSPNAEVRWSRYTVKSRVLTHHV